MSQLLIQTYLNDLSDLKRVSGTVRESVVSEAFKTLLKNWGRSEGLVFVPEYEIETPDKQRRYVDGALLSEIRLPFGYWEAKDEKDNLDEEIATKFRRGYPQDNIVFEDSREAVLIQNRKEITRADVHDPDALERLLKLFFGYERAEIANFRKAVEQFKTDLPKVLEALREKIEDAFKGNEPFKADAIAFLKHAQQTINPSITADDVREMLIQHILTEEIFSKVFGEDDFHRQNNVAQKLYALEQAFFTGNVKRQTLRSLEPYYAAIRASAASIPSHQEKQAFLKVIYENFYKIYNPKAADRLGVVYTPNEIVRFMIESADWLTQKHFSKRLIDKGVEILDPATGTGTFITELLEYFRGQPEKLKYKYREELHANEVAILPYYVANLNIEATYAAIIREYAEYPNLCFVDTLDNLDWRRAGEVGLGDLFAGLSTENLERVRRQNKRRISVVIGNPPYNANQKNENEDNQNRTYPAIDKLIKATYIKNSEAQKTKLYDMYVRFVRWASERVDENGVVAFVSNSSFLHKNVFDGFRKVVAREFNEAWVIDLKGDARTAGEERRRQGGNIFGNNIRVGIAIYFFVKKKGASGFQIHYDAVPDYAKLDEKSNFLVSRIGDRKMSRLTPDAGGNWLNQIVNDASSHIAIASRETKAAKRGANDRAIFKLYSLGVSTNRDEWVYDLDRGTLVRKIKDLIETYDQVPSNAEQLPASIKWSRNLKRRKLQGRREPFLESRIVRAAYRPFAMRWLYKSSLFIDEAGATEAMFPDAAQNVSMCFSEAGSRTGYVSLAVAGVADLHFGAAADGYQQVPRYRYLNGERLDNITDWALKQFRAHYTSAEGVDSLPARTMTAKGAAAGERSLGKGEVASSGDPSRVKGGRAKAATASAAARPPSALRAPSPDGGREGRREVSKDDIFHYVYGVLHDPVYRETYALNLKREFPRIPFYADFAQWAAWGERLMALHIGYEAVVPFGLMRLDVPDTKSRTAGVPPKTMLKADKDAGTIRLDSETTLSGVPEIAWTYRLGNRSALEWILDQHKEKTPKDPTIRAKFNTYRFADHKEKVVDLLDRVTRVSVETMEIVGAMKAAKR